MSAENPQSVVAIVKARQAGTYGQVDRSKQYEGRYSPELLLKSIDAAHANLRQAEKDRFRHHLVVMVVGAALARAPEIGAWLLRILL